MGPNTPRSSTAGFSSLRKVKGDRIIPWTSVLHTDLPHSFWRSQSILLYPCIPIPYTGSNKGDSKSSVFLAKNLRRLEILLSTVVTSVADEVTARRKEEKTQPATLQAEEGPCLGRAGLLHRGGRSRRASVEAGLEGSREI